MTKKNEKKYIFTDHEDFAEYNIMAKKVKNKRKHYKYTNSHKVYSNDVFDNNVVKDDIYLWETLTEISKILASHYPVYFENGLFYDFNKGNLYYKSDDCIAFDFGLIRSWRTKYFGEKYKYKGKIYKELPCEEITAEIIGSEDLNISERIFLLSSTLEYLEAGYSINQLNFWLEMLINFFKQGQTANNLIMSMILFPSNLFKI
jgi:hypothetical protein